MLSGRKIEGNEFFSARAWQRRQTADGVVEYDGFPIQGGLPWIDNGTARIEDDMLCEEWSETTYGVPMELCSVIFRMPEGEARIRWSDYVMVTDTGPHPFKLVE